MDCRLESSTTRNGSGKPGVAGVSGSFCSEDFGSSADFAISSSREACRASSCAFAWGERGGRALRVERADDLRDGDLNGS